MIISQLVTCFKMGRKDGTATPNNWYAGASRASKCDLGGVEPLLVGKWEPELLRRMHRVNETLEAQIGFRAAHQRFEGLKAQAAGVD
jgi:hypothetical protein